MGFRRRSSLFVVAGAAVAGALAANACTSFGAEDTEDTKDAGPDGAADGPTGTDATSPPVGDASGDSPAGQGIRCGSLVCSPGGKCCMGSGDPTCAQVCPADTWTMECAGPSDCGGAKPVCCWNTATPLTLCAATCTGSFTVCEEQADCDGAVCAPAKCEGKVSLQVCQKPGTAFVDFGGTTPECQPP